MNAWGYIVSAIAGVQGSLYLLVLTVNSIIAVARGLAVGLARCSDVGRPRGDDIGGDAAAFGKC